MGETAAVSAQLELRTERLILRRWRPADRAPFAAMNADERVWRWLSGPIDRSASDDFVDRIEACFQDRGWGLWAVEVPHGERFAGFVGLWEVTFEAAFPERVEVGWRLAPAAWGRGYATEAATAALRDAWERVGLDSVVSFTAESNLRSRAVMERIGLTHRPDEDFDHPRLAPDHPLRRHVLYRAVASDPGVWHT